MQCPACRALLDDSDEHCTECGLPQETPSKPRVRAAIELEPWQGGSAAQLPRDAPPEPELADALAQVAVLAASDPGLHRIAAPATNAKILAREKQLGVPFPAPVWQLYRFADGFALFDEPGSLSTGLQMVPLDALHTFASMCGDDLQRERRRWLARDEGYDDPGRLRIFDVGNGDYVSGVELSGSWCWIDDWHERVEDVITSSTAHLLRFMLDPKHVAGRRWRKPRWSELE